MVQLFNRIKETCGDVEYYGMASGQVWPLPFLSHAWLSCVRTSSPGSEKKNQARKLTECLLPPQEPAAHGHLLQVRPR